MVTSGRKKSFKLYAKQIFSVLQVRLNHQADFSKRSSFKPAFLRPPNIKKTPSEVHRHFQQNSVPERFKY